MRVVVQKVTEAAVLVGGEIIGEIGKGFMLLVGIGKEDAQEDVCYLARKVANLRVFEDEEGKMNRSLKDVGGDILSISQFTLFADTKKGNRPSYIKASKPEIRDAVEAIWGVEVLKVNTLNRPGKRKRTRGTNRIGQRPDTKRAIVTLAAGEIPLFEN